MNSGLILAKLVFPALALVVYLALLAKFRFRQHRTSVFLALFTLFYWYLYKVLDLTLFEFQSLLLLKMVFPGLVLRGLEASEAVQWLPLVGLTSADAVTSLLNVALMVPFGLGLPFLLPISGGRVIAGGAVLSLAIEAVQWTTGAVAQVTFRIADVNDLIFNTLGVAIGYGLFRALLVGGRSLVRRRGWEETGVGRHLWSLYPPPRPAN